MRKRTLVASLVGVVSLAFAVAPTAGAQSPARDLRGMVIDTAGRPLPNAEVRIMDLARATRTDSNGKFVMAGIKDRIVDVAVRRLGYEMRVVRVSMMNGEGDDARIVLRAEPVVLAGVAVEAPEAPHPFFIEFEKRRSRGIGTFLTERDLDKLNTSLPSDAFRTLPGMRLVRLNNGGSGVRFSSTQGMRNSRGGECVPTIWVDGQAAPGMEIDDVRAGDIHGIEIYRGASTVPSQFSGAGGGGAQCGVIVIWTRRKGKG